MGRSASLAPYQDAKSKSWVLSVPPSLSPTGKRKREFFGTKKEADKRAEQLKAAREAGSRIAQVAGPDLIRCAVNYDELFRTVYGMGGGLEEACESFIAHLEATTQGLKLVDLLEGYGRERFDHWSLRYRRNWKWFRGLLVEIEGNPVVMVSSADYWTAWLDGRSQEGDWKPDTFNNVAAMLSAVWNAAYRKGVVERNPILGVARRKRTRRAVPVYTVDQVRTLMNAAWEHDRDFVPYFAIAVFAGLRPDERSEITALDWEDVNFNDRWIRVAAEFDNKTETKRFVPIEQNLMLWLEPWRDALGPVVPKNMRKRRRDLVRGKFQSLPGTPESQWVPLVPYGQEVKDITRHTYGSYLEAKYRDRNVVKENMGHSDFTTYEQHYRNARSPQEAEEFWSLVPPGAQV